MDLFLSDAAIYSFFLSFSGITLSGDLLLSILFSQVRLQKYSKTSNKGSEDSRNRKFYAIAGVLVCIDFVMSLLVYFLVENSYMDFVTLTLVPSALCVTRLSTGVFMILYEILLHHNMEFAKYVWQILLNNRALFNVGLKNLQIETYPIDPSKLTNFHAVKSLEGAHIFSIRIYKPFEYEFRRPYFNFINRNCIPVGKWNISGNGYSRHTMNKMKSKQELLLVHWRVHYQFPCISFSSH